MARHNNHVITFEIIYLLYFLPSPRTTSYFFPHLGICLIYKYREKGQCECIEIRL